MASVNRPTGAAPSSGAHASRDATDQGGRSDVGLGALISFLPAWVTFASRASAPVRSAFYFCKGERTWIEKT
jgi:hypothetical protein